MWSSYMVERGRGGGEGRGGERREERRGGDEDEVKEQEDGDKEYEDENNDNAFQEADDHQRLGGILQHGKGKELEGVGAVGRA